MGTVRLALGFISPGGPFQVPHLVECIAMGYMLILMR
jgi:hypothetical protein